MNSIKIKSILELLDIENIYYKYKGSKQITLRLPSSIDKLEDYSLSFLRSINIDQYLNSIKPNNLIILKLELATRNLPKANYLFVKNPSLCFNIVAWLFKEKKKISIHSSAIIDNTAILPDDISVGANSIIGPGVEIGNGVQIDENCVIKNSFIGSNVRIQSGVKIGNMGLGSYLHENGKWVDFPHFGNVIIENNVVIQDNTVINRGSLNDTTIKKYSRIGPLCCIAHGVSIGESCFISQASTIAGSVKIGDQSTIWGNSSIRDGVTIGKNCVIGLGAVVVKNVPDKQLWVGNPARFMKKISL